MRVSLNLLKEFSDFKTDVGTILETISGRIGEVESAVATGPKYKGIVVGQVIASRPHPQADKLSVNQVDIGRRRVQVIAGDKTLSPGQRVAYIPPGVVVPSTVDADQLKIEIRSIRGLNSHGMLASAKELDFSNDHRGVLKLDERVSVGTPLADLFKLDDTIIDVETKVLTHRPDMFGHLGFARELSAALGQNFVSPDWYAGPATKLNPAKAILNLKLNNLLPALVPRFSLTVFDGVKSSQSPIQIQSWLMRLGVRPQNNVVDLTNYLMLVSGQPLHAYDYDKVADGRPAAEIAIRHPRAGEQLTLINGKQIDLRPDSIVIADHRQAIGLAGVMGGQSTEVDNHTQRVIIEAANFDMYAVRNMTMAYGLSSEAATRFARGPSPAPIARVQVESARLLKSWSGAQLANGMLDDYPKPVQTRTIKSSVQAVNNLLGTQDSGADMAKTLNRAEIPTQHKRGQLWVNVPAWRSDLELSVDIAEEVGKLNGYSRIAARLPHKDVRPAPVSRLNTLSQSVRRLLSAAGSNEILTYSGVPKKLLQSSLQAPEDAYKIRNALSPDMAYMRLSLMPSLLDKIYANRRQGYNQFGLFEIGSVHHQALIEEKLPAEQNDLAWVATIGQSNSQPAGAAYFDAVRYLTYLANELNLDFELASSSPKGDPWLAQVAAPFDPARRAFIDSGKITLGVVGEFAPEVSSGLKLPAQTAGFELHLDRLISAIRQEADQLTLSRYPSLSVEVTFRSANNLAYGRLLAALRGWQPKEAKVSIEPLAIFAPDKSHIHTSFRLSFVSLERTLTQSEVNKWLARMVARVTKQTGATQV